MKVLERAAEVRFVGEHRQRGGSPLLVRLGNLGRLGSVPDRSGTRRAPLELGDHRQAGPGQRFAERTLLGTFAQAPLEVLQGNLSASPRNARPGVTNQLFDHAHLVGEWCLG